MESIHGIYVLSRDKTIEPCRYVSWAKPSFSDFWRIVHSLMSLTFLPQETFIQPRTLCCDSTAVDNLRHLRDLSRAIDQHEKQDQ